MRVEIAKTYEGLSRRAAALVMAALERCPHLLLCASAGNTPTAMYELLAAQRRRQPKLFRKLRILQLDEWGGLAADHGASCRADLESKLLEPLAIDSTRFFGFRGDAPDPEAECRRMTRWLAAHGPIDVCILGLGANGHIAMNEPAPALRPGIHVARLSARSRRHSMLAGLKRKPGYGLTLGFAEILAAREILLLVSGRAKAGVLKRTLEGRVTSRCPASLLWLHPNVTVLCDRAARPKYLKLQP